MHVGSVAGKVGALIITTQTLPGGRAGHHHGSQGAYRLDGLGSGVGGVLDGSRQRPHHLEPCLGNFSGMVVVNEPPPAWVAAGRRRSHYRTMIVVLQVGRVG